MKTLRMKNSPSTSNVSVILRLVCLTAAISSAVAFSACNKKFLLPALHSGNIQHFVDFFPPPPQPKRQQPPWKQPEPFRMVFRSSAGVPRRMDCMSAKRRIPIMKQLAVCVMVRKLASSGVRATGIKSILRTATLMSVPLIFLLPKS